MAGFAKKLFCPPNAFEGTIIFSFSSTAAILNGMPIKDDVISFKVLVPVTPGAMKLRRKQLLFLVSSFTNGCSVSFVPVDFFFSFSFFFILFVEFPLIRTSFLRGRNSFFFPKKGFVKGFERKL